MTLPLLLHTNCCNSGGSALLGQPGVGGANHRGGLQLMRFTWLDPDGQCHCYLAECPCSILPHITQPPPTINHDTPLQSLPGCTVIVKYTPRS